MGGGVTEGSKVAFPHRDYPLLCMKGINILWGSNTQLDSTKKFGRKIREKIHEADGEAARYSLPYLISNLHEEIMFSKKACSFPGSCSRKS